MSAPTILVTGMHRSGTSLVAALLEGCGVHLGDPSELIPPAGDNPAGFWEHERITGLNDRLLAELGGAWDAPPSPEPGWHLADRLGGLRAEAAELVDRLSDHGVWGFKDPRTMLLADFWLEACQPARIVLCIRNPLEVARSLHARNGHTAPLALRLWWTYHEQLRSSLDRWTATPDPVVVHYREVLADPHGQLERLCVGLELPATAIDAVTVDRLDRGLRHHRLGDAELIEVGAAPRLVHRYVELCRQAGATEDLVAEAVPEGRDAGETTEPADADGAVDRIGAVDIERLDHADLRSRYHVRGGHIALLERRLAEAAKRIAELEHQVREREAPGQITPSSVAVSQPPAPATEHRTEHRTELRAVLERLDDLALHIGAGGSDPAAPIAAAHRALRRLVERATGAGTRVGIVGGTADPPVDRHLTEVPPSPGIELLDLLAAEGVDAIAVATGIDHPRVEETASALGWTELEAVAHVGTIWSTAPRAPSLADALRDWCDDAELRSGRPASVLDLTSGRHGDLVADRVVFRPEAGVPDQLMPLSVDLVVVDAGDSSSPGHPAASSATLVVGTDGIEAHRGPAQGRIASTSLVLVGMPERFADHVTRRLPAWWNGEVLHDASSDALPALATAARGEAVICVNGTWLPTPGAFAPLVDALTHGSVGSQPAGIAVARTVGPDDSVDGWVRHRATIIRPDTTAWTARRNDGPFGGWVVGVSRAVWEEWADPDTGADDPHGTWVRLGARAADDWASLWVPDSRWVGLCAGDPAPDAPAQQVLEATT